MATMASWMESLLFEESTSWDLMDFNITGDASTADSLWTANLDDTRDVNVTDNSPAKVVPTKRNSKRKRNNDTICREEIECIGGASRACREKLRRDKMNDRFLDLCSMLGRPWRAGRINKSTILDDAICALQQSRSEAEALRDHNKKLQDEITILKAEKSELREEKLQLKADKERLVRQLNSSP